jgi:hypothetical protein
MRVPGASLGIGQPAVQGDGFFSGQQRLPASARFTESQAEVCQGFGEIGLVPVGAYLGEPSADGDGLVELGESVVWPGEIQQTRGEVGERVRDVRLVAVRVALGEPPADCQGFFGMGYRVLRLVETLKDVAEIIQRCREPTKIAAWVFGGQTRRAGRGSDPGRRRLAGGGSLPLPRWVPLIRWDGRARRGAYQAW